MQTPDFEKTQESQPEEKKPNRLDELKIQYANYTLELGKIAYQKAGLEQNTLELCEKVRLINNEVIEMNQAKGETSNG